MREATPTRSHAHTLYPEAAPIYVCGSKGEMAMKCGEGKGALSSTSGLPGEGLLGLPEMEGSPCPWGH